MSACDMSGSSKGKLSFELLWWLQRWFLPKQSESFLQWVSLYYLYWTDYIYIVSFCTWQAYKSCKQWSVVIHPFSSATNMNFQDSLPNTDLFELTPMKLKEDLFSNLTEISSHFTVLVNFIRWIYVSTSFQYSLEHSYHRIHFVSVGTNVTRT